MYLAFSQSQISHRTGSPLRSVLGMGNITLQTYIFTIDPAERAEIEAYAREEYLRSIDLLKEQEGVTAEDVKDFEKAALIQRAVDTVKARSQLQDQIRKDPSRYRKVESRIKRNIRVQQNSKARKSVKRQDSYARVNNNDSTSYHITDMENGSRFHYDQSFLSAEKKSEMIGGSPLSPPKINNQDSRKNRKSAQILSARQKFEEPFNISSPIAEQKSISPTQHQQKEMTEDQINEWRQSIDKKYLKELKSMPNPPQHVAQTVAALQILLNYPDLSWSAGQKLLGQNNLIDILTHFDIHNVPKTTIDKLGKFIKDNNLDPASITAKSMAAGALCRFIVGSYKYCLLLDNKKQQAQQQSQIQQTQQPQKYNEQQIQQQERQKEVNKKQNIVPNLEIKQVQQHQQKQFTQKPEEQMNNKPIQQKPHQLQQELIQIPKIKNFTSKMSIEHGYNEYNEEIGIIEYIEKRIPGKSQPKQNSQQQSQLNSDRKLQLDNAKDSPNKKSNGNTVNVKEKQKGQMAGFNKVCKTDSFQVRAKTQGQNAGFNRVTKQMTRKDSNKQIKQQNSQEQNTIEQTNNLSNQNAGVTTFQVKQKTQGVNAGFNKVCKPGGESYSVKQRSQGVMSQPPIAVQNQQSYSPQIQQEQLLQQNQYDDSLHRNQSQDFSNMAESKLQAYQEEFKFQNKDIEQKTAAVQEEFDRLLEEMVNRKEQKSGQEDFYQFMQEQYGRGEGDEKHESPTKRLIALKKSTTDHKTVMKNNFQRQEYSLTYCSSPGKSYIIEPHGGELNYNLAQKNPLKFYDQVFNQDITKHKVKEDQQTNKKAQVEISSKVTKRPHLKIMLKIQQKLTEKLKEKIGEEFGQNILAALQDKTIDNSIKILLKEEKLQLFNEKNQPVYKEQIKQAVDVSKNISIQQYSDNVDDTMEQELDDCISPEMKASRTKIVRLYLQNNILIQGMKEQDFKRIETKVRDHIRRNSKKDVRI